MGERPEIRDGGEWADHEDLLVANEEGLRRLRDACDIALREGEYIKGDLGQWVGVRRMDTAWFDHPEETVSTRIGNKVVGLVLLAILAIFVIGLWTVARWVLA